MTKFTCTKIYVSDVSKFPTCFGTYDMPKHVGDLLTSDMYILGASVVCCVGLLSVVIF
jgi:hypothetical protein